MGGAVIIGAGPGLGSALARRFGRGAMPVALIARSPQRLEPLVAELTASGTTAYAVAGDAGDAESVTGAVEQAAGLLGGVEALLFNAVALRQATASEVSPAELAADLAVGIGGLLSAVRAVLPGMRAARRGSVLATGGGTFDHPWPAAATLGVQKAGLRNLVLALAAELAPAGIHVATVTVRGTIEPGTAYDPDRIAEEFWLLHAEKVEDWSTEVDYRG